MSPWMLDDEAEERRLFARRAGAMPPEEVPPLADILAMADGLVAKDEPRATGRVVHLSHAKGRAKVAPILAVGLAIAACAAGVIAVVARAPAPVVAEDVATPLAATAQPAWVDVAGLTCSPAEPKHVDGTERVERTSRERACGANEGAEESATYAFASVERPMRFSEETTMRAASFASSPSHEACSMECARETSCANAGP